LLYDFFSFALFFLRHNLSRAGDDQMIYLHSLS
jgi:hypothetical protein